MTNRKIGRSAITGQFVTEKEVKKNPKTTVTETIKYPEEREEVLCEAPEGASFKF